MVSSGLLRRVALVSHRRENLKSYKRSNVYVVKQIPGVKCQPDYTASHPRGLDTEWFWTHLKICAIRECLVKQGRSVGDSQTRFRRSIFTAEFLTRQRRGQSHSNICRLVRERCNEMRCVSEKIN
jgi:hypothetical protein